VVSPLLAVKAFEAIALRRPTATRTGYQDAEHVAALCRWAAPSLNDGVTTTVPASLFVAPAPSGVPESHWHLKLRYSAVER